MAIASNNRASHSPPESARRKEVATGTGCALTPGLAGGGGQRHSWRRRRQGWATAVRLQAFVVGTTALRIGQHGIGLLHGPKGFRCRGCRQRGGIRVIALAEGAKGLAEIISRGRRSEAQPVVMVQALRLCWNRTTNHLASAGCAGS